MANDPSKVSGAVQKMRVKLELVRALMGGTAAMQEAGENYLPKFPNEDKDSYKARLEASTLLPAYSETVHNMNGRVFAEPVTMGEDSPETIVKYSENIDQQGNNLQVWVQDYFSEALATGLCHALVDFPSTADERGRAMYPTRAAEMAAGVRPYAVIIKPDQVLGWKSKAINGAETLTQFRYMESIEEDDPESEFDTKCVEQVRVLEPGVWRTFRKRRGEGGKEEWYQHAAGTTSLPVIPLVTYYTKRTGFMTAVPPLMELAYLNRKHWQKQSSLDNMEITALVPMLALFGVDDDSFQMTVGSSVATKLPKDGDMKWVELDGKAIELNQKALDRLIDEMRMAGAKLLQKEKQATKTAAQAEEEAAQELSPLETMAGTLEDAIDQILQFFALWIGEKEGGHVQVNGNFEVDFDPQSSLPFLQYLHTNRVMSDETLFSEGKRRGIISDEVEWEAERDRIDQQGPALGTIRNANSQ